MVKQRYFKAEDALWVRVKVAAAKQRKTINRWVTEALEEKLKREK